MRGPDLADTICACATTLPSPIAVIRLSGDLALPVLQASVPQYRFKHSHIQTVPLVRDGFCDDAMIWAAKGPKTYTGEDYAEVMVHGSIEITRWMLEFLVAAGARIAKPGEFGYRAYLRGKQPLMKVLSVHSVIYSQKVSDLQVIRDLRNNRADLLLKHAKIHAIALYNTLQMILDYTEQGYGVCELETEITKLTDTFAYTLGDLHQCLSPLVETAQIPIVSIVGPPNSGKSTLFNKLVGYDRAIISPWPGTTRDYVSHPITHDGRSFQLVDTAGLRQTDDPVEQLGIQEAEQLLHRSCALIWVVALNDWGTETEQEIEQLLQKVSSPIWVWGNKRDAASEGMKASFAQWSVKIQNQFPLVMVGMGSLLSDLTMEQRTDILTHTSQAVGLGGVTPGLLPATIHTQCVELLSRGKAVVSEIRSGHFDLGQVLLEQLLPTLSLFTGEISQDEIYERLFASFCLGK